MARARACVSPVPLLGRPCGSLWKSCGCRPSNAAIWWGGLTTPLHQLDAIEDVIEAAGAGVRFLPTSWPELNPLALCWAKVKSRLRSLTPRTLPDLLDALGHAFSTIPLHDILHWVQPCGYQVAATPKSL